MENKAAMELQALLEAGSETVNAADSLAKLRENRADMPMQVTGDADFALPEAIATGAAAGFLLGPAGGLILGVAQGLLGKQARQSALDQMAYEDGVLRQSNAIIDDELDRRALEAENEDDLQQLSTLQSMKDAGMRMLASASPRLQEQGAELMQQFSTGLEAYSTRQETQRIDREVRAAELGEKQYERYDGLKKQFDAESAAYSDISKHIDTAFAALESGSPSDLYASVQLLQKAIDPMGVVRGEDVEMISNLSGLLDKAIVSIEKAKNGTSILPEQRREMVGTLETMYQVATEHQLAREARYSDYVMDADLPEKYHDNFRLVENVPAVTAPTIRGQNATLPEATGFLDPARSVATDAIENAAGGGIVSEIATRVPQWRQSLSDWYSGSGRQRRQDRTKNW